MSHVSSSCLSCCSILLGDPPSWVVSHELHVLSQASITWPSHARGMLAHPPHDGEAYMLFSRLLKEPHMSFFHPYWSWSLCCLRHEMGLEISFMLVNFQGQHATRVPNLLLEVVHRVVCTSPFAAVIVPAVIGCARL
jgi:hypothetical protein